MSSKGICFVDKEGINNEDVLNLKYCSRYDILKLKTEDEVCEITLAWKKAKSF